MGTVNVQIAGRAYDLACEDGQETRLGALAAMVNQEAQALARQLGTPGEARLLAMVALLMADRLDEAGVAAGAAEEAAAMRKALTTAQGERDALEAERDALREERDELRAEGETLRAERDALRQALEAAQASETPNLFDDATLAQLDAAADRLERVVDEAERT